jgi:hypothetical protein
MPDEGERLADVDIDPSFPDDPNPDPLTIENWAAEAPANDKHWLVRSDIRLPDEFFYRDRIGSNDGPWVAVYAFLNTREELHPRRVFGFATGMLVAKKDVQRLVEALQARKYPGNRWLPEPPTAYYTFAGEIPWHPEFGRYRGGGNVDYTHEIELEDGSSIEIEALAHEYGWETYHSELNRAGGAIVPSGSLSRDFDLRATPNSFDQVAPDGSVAAVSMRAPEGFSGHVLYVREDLIKRYAEGRQLVWFAWGERELRRHGYADPPRWVMDAIRRHDVVWRVIRLGSDLSPRLAPGKRRRRRKSPPRR